MSAPKVIQRPNRSFDTPYHSFTPLERRSELGVVGAGFVGGQAKYGVDMGPEAVIDSGILDILKQDLGLSIFWDHAVYTYEDLAPHDDPPYHNMNRPRTVSAATKKISSQVYEHALQGRRILTLGGDHSIAIGTISGVAKAFKDRFDRDLAVIWVDAHADINTAETSDSGNIHGMPLAFLTGLAAEEPADIFGWLQKDHLISTTRLVYIGLRDLDRSEKECLQNNRIKAFFMDDVHRLGIERVMNETMAWIGADTPIHLSFDIDSLDPTWAPSTGFPVPGGLTLRQGQYIAKRIHQTGNLVGLDLVEINPDIAKEGKDKTVQSGCSVLLSALGKVEHPPSPPVYS